MSETPLSRRQILQIIGAAAVARAASPETALSAQTAAEKTSSQSKDLPRICLGGVAPDDAPAMRRLKQIGVEFVLTGGPKIPRGAS